MILTVGAPKTATPVPEIGALCTVVGLHPAGLGSGRQKTPSEENPNGARNGALVLGGKL
jgi:hypothetical protein